jgi:hypothetical protein
MKKKFLLLSVLIAGSFYLQAQSFTTIASGLLNPVGMAHDSAWNIYVTEAGTGNHDARISIIHLGVRFTVVDSLPSVYDTVIHEVVGPWRCYITNNMLTVIVGGKSGANMGSIFTFDISSYVAGGPAMSMADAVDVFHVASWALMNGFIDSDIFSAAWDSSGDSYIADAGANAVFKRDLSNNLTVVDTFPAILNTVTPFPPYIDYVPTKIINGRNGNFYLCNLTGFPFLGGFSSIVSIDPSTGMDTVIASGLTLSVDMEMDSMDNELYVLQFGRYDTNFMAIPNSAVIMSVDSAGNMDTIVTGFGPSAAMMADSADGYYVTEIYSGTLLHISLTTGIPNYYTSDAENLKVYPNPFRNELNIALSIPSATAVSYEVSDITGKLLYNNAQSLPAGLNRIQWNGISNNGNRIVPGIYFLTVNTENRSFNTRIIVR